MSEDVPATRKPRPGGLGRGLNALFGDIARDEPVADPDKLTPGVRMLPVGAIKPNPAQPRRRFDESGLQELADSIAQRGVIQPIVVRPHGHGYQIVAGERRWRAAQRARLDEVPVVIRDFSDTETLEVALVENIQRQDLNAIEEAAAYQRLIADFGHTQEALARIVHKSRSHVTNLLRLLDLPVSIQTHIVDGLLTMGHGRALIGAPDPDLLAMQVIRRGLSVRATEKLVSEAKPVVRRQRAQPTPASGNADIDALEHQLGDMLGLSVKIAHTDSGGTIYLSYSTLDQLDMICQRLSGEPI